MSDTGLDIGTLSGRIELEDRLSSILDLAGHKVTEFDERFGGLGHHMAEQIGAFFTAEAALEAVKEAAHFAAETFKELTMGGAQVADVEENFHRLTSEAGRLSSTLLNELKEGTHGTVTDFELMKRVNADLAAGLNISDKQYRTLAEGAFALAQATGGDVTEAFDKMSDAMLTGRTRAVAMLTGKIDLAEAEERFALKLHTTTDRLSAEGKMEAARVAILDTVGAAVKRLGEQSDGLDEKVQQAHVTWKNFEEDLAKTVATSPVLLTGLDGISEALSAAFGGEKEDLIQNIATGIDNAAIEALEFAKTVVDGVALAGIGWNALKVVIVDVEQGIRAITYVAEGTFLVLMKIANFASGGSLFGDAIKATEKDMDRLYQAMATGEQKIAEYKKAEDEWAVSTGHVNEEIERIRQRMIAAQQTQEERKRALEDGKAAEEHAAEATAAHNEELAKQAFVMKQTAEEAKRHREALAELASVGTDWHTTVREMDQEMVASIKHYLEAGVGQGTLAQAYSVTATQVTAVAKALKEEEEALKLEAKQVLDSTARWEQYYAMVKESSGTTTDAIIADIDRWRSQQVKSHQQAQTDTEDFYKWLEASEAEMYRQSDQRRLLDDEHSKEHFQQLARDAQDAFEFASSHSDQFTQDYVVGLERTAVAAKHAAENWDHELGGSLDRLNDKAKKLTEAMSFNVTKGNWDQAGLTGTGWGALTNTLMGQDKNAIYGLLEQGFSLQNAIAVLQGGMNPKDWKGEKGPRVPGFREGGVGDFGAGTLVELHGREMITPLDKVDSIGPTVLNFYVNGTAEESARKIGDILMKQARMGRKFGTA